MPPTFCPYCCNCLTISRAQPTPQTQNASTNGTVVALDTSATYTGLNAFTCRTCPYQFVLDQPYYERNYTTRKQKSDVMGEQESDLPINEVPGGCRNEKCNSRHAYFYQLQTRSADEPPTSFYRCVECGKQWSEF